jgi:hypothetical protein
MNEQPIAHLESQLERLVEGAFAHLFGRHTRAQDLAVELARAMQEAATSGTPRDPRPIAPDHYCISLNTQTRDRLLHKQPTLLDRLSNHLLELATNLGYRMICSPTIELVTDDSVNTPSFRVQANHSLKKHSTTAVMKRVEIPAFAKPGNPQILIAGHAAINLVDDVVNIGRGHDNQIVIEDPSVSRHHLQLRLRFGRYTLFDTESRGGTWVNNVRIHEHNLQNGDVVQVGSTQFVYMEDHPMGETQTGITPPVEPD